MRGGTGVRIGTHARRRRDFARLESTPCVVAAASTTLSLGDTAHQKTTTSRRRLVDEGREAGARSRSASGKIEVEAKTMRRSAKRYGREPRLSCSTTCRRIRARRSTVIAGAAVVEVSAACVSKRPDYALRAGM